MKNSFYSHKASMLTAIGNTPIVQLHKVVPPECADIYVKLEFFNPTGAYKDRMALAMIEEAEARGELRPNMTVVEYTGGSTGSSLAFVCAAKGYRFKVVSSDAYAKEKLDTMRAFGADLTIVPSDGGKITPDLVSRLIEKAKEFSAVDNTYFTDQLNNRDSLEGYKKIGLELIEQIDRQIDAFCGGVGTAGMLMGVDQIIRNRYSTRIIALEPESVAVKQ
jgi:cysteine synthase A